MELVQQSIAYIDRKYGIGTYAKLTEEPDSHNVPRDMRLSIWYTRKQGARLARRFEDTTVYAMDGTGEHYVGIPNEGWVDLLGFVMTDVEIVEDDHFEGMEHMGVIVK
jgi:hypothetical protein